MSAGETDAARADPDSLRPVRAFVLTSIILAAAIAAFLLWSMWGSGPGARFDFNRDAGVIVLAFFVSWFMTIFAGVAIGVPVLLGLRSLGLHRRLAALLPAGLIAGALFMMMIAFALTGPFSVAVYWPFIAMGSGAGLVAGALWWLFAVEPRRDNG